MAQLDLIQIQNKNIGSSRFSGVDLFDPNPTSRYIFRRPLVCMKYDIYFLKETDGILNWEEIGIFGKSNHNEGTMFFPKIIRPTKNYIFPFWPEIHLLNDRYDHQNESQILFENWTKNMSREINDNFPLNFTNRMSLLRILQI